ncbi:type I polyketide synthase [Dactylosporangium sp. NPDC049140]|uniref:type I polyketide synthase n=1 Tax=Dactylosporangium sp. NPDC049140 TaxID=3155647 RepID=UPI0033D56A2F
MPDVEPIAIVGAGIRFPGGNESLDDFAAFLRRGGNAIRPVPEDRWDSAAFTSDDPEARGKIRAAGFGFIDQIDQFDAPFFGVSPLEAQYTDPQQRMLLEVAWEALEHANIDYETLRHGSGGVYIGASCIDFALELDSLSYEELDGHLAAGITMFPMSGRLSYFLGWQGPSLTTDTACASSLTALHLAAEGLRNGECDIALAGGVAAIHHPRIPVMFTHGSMLAPDGQCKTFDDSANGYVRAEGCGVLVLKRLGDARRDGDRIIGVVRGTAIGQDGASAGLTVPNGTAQEGVMRTALRVAGADPGDVQYVEAHGTGTALGDPIEMGAIVDVFGASHTRERPLVVSSVKTNVGHMEPVAGIGGLVKVLLQMRERSYFPHLNMTKPSGRIPWDRIPVSIPTGLRPWEAETRRAVINSFGFGGAIAAAVVEEPAASGQAPPPPAPGAAVFTLSAKSKRSLGALLQRYRDRLAADPELTAEDVCYTANVGRTHLPLRVSGVVGGRAELDRLLERELARVDKAAGATRRKVAFLFAGQGAQYPGMGAALYEQFPVFREQVDACDERFAGPLGCSVRELMFGDDADRLRQTRYTQAALFTLEYALAKLWLSWGVRPHALIGHSIGEVAAAAVAGLFTLDDAVRLVAARGRLMQSVTASGGMAAVDAPAEELAAAVAEHPQLAVAALNSPQQTVVSGETGALDRLCATLEAQGRKVTRLAVSHAFHSPQMREVYDGFRRELAGIEFHEPTLTLVSNLTGKVARFAELADVEYWVRHIGEPVDFRAGMATIEKRGTHAFVEIGPGRSLTAPARQCVTGEKHLWLSSLDRNDPEGVVVREALAQYYRAGGAVHWPGFHAGRERRKVGLPTYAFDRKRYWLPIKGPRHGVGGARTAGGRLHHPLLGAEIAAGEGVREFKARWSATAPAYVADHVIMGRVVMPGTGYLEALLALQDAVFGEAGRPVTDVRILEPLFLPDDGDVEVRVRLRDGVRAEIVSVADGGVERAHLRAVIGEPGPAALTEAGEALLSRAAQAEPADEVVDAETVYRLYAAAGLEYGPQFRRMGDVSRYGADFATGELRGADADAAELVPPFIVDAATHAFAAVGNDGNSYLPVRYTSFRMFKKPKAATLRVLLRLDPDPVPEVDIAIDLVALEGDRPVFELRGLGMKRVADNGARRELAHDLRWLRRSLVGRGEEPHSILAVRAPQHARGALNGSRFVDEPGAADLHDVSDVCWFWEPGGTLAEESERNYRRLLDLLRTLGEAGFGRDQRLWLVTERAQHLAGDAAGLDRPPAAASLWGFGHTLLNEHPAYRTTMVDLPGDEGGYGSLLEEVGASPAGEFQIAYRDGRRHVRRLVPLELAAPGPDDSFALAIREYGQFAGVRKVHAERVAPRGDEVEILVRAAGLNFKDVLNALGLLKEFGEQPLGFEAAGTVVAAGPEATHRVGDDVVVNYLGCMQRHVVAPSTVVVAKPPRLSHAEAAGLPAAYVTAHYALHTLAGIKAGDRILIHAAAGGVGQAAVQLAKAAGAEIYATASPHKWPLLREQGVTRLYNSRSLDFAAQLLEQTGGAGVDIVLNSLNKDFIPASMSCLGRNGRFVEMGKVGAWTPEQVRAERPDVAYHNFDLSELPWDDAVRVTAEAMRLVIGQVADGTLAPLRTSVYSLDEVEEAFGVLSRGANLGKLVLDLDGPRRGAPVELRDDRTYVVTGGLGALGVVTARALVSAGARHIVLTGRGGTPAADVAGEFERLGQDADVRVIRGDIAKDADVVRILAEAGRPWPVGGIVHSAGTLQDAPVAAQTWETIEPVFSAKVYGTWLLHRAARDLPELDFLVGYSSAAPIVGTPGQANYSAANAFLDEVMVRRFAAGTPGTTVNWGPWGEVGMSARLADVLYKRWADEGIVLTTPAVGMRALRALLRRPAGQAVVGECDWDRFAGGKPVANAVYQRLLSDSGAGGTDRPDLDELAAAPREERLARIDAFVRARVAAVLHFDDADAVDSATEFVRLGLDSLVAVELKNSLEAAFGVPLPSAVALEYPSAELLAEFIDRQMFPEPAAV